MGDKGATTFKSAIQNVNAAKITYADLAAEENKEESKQESGESEEEYWINELNLSQIFDLL